MNLTTHNLCSKIKLAIADDNKSFRNTLVGILQLNKAFEVVLLANNGIDLLIQLKNIKPDIILMNIRMAKMDGIEAIDKVLELYPQFKIIAFSQYDFRDNIIEMYLHGVKSFIGKEDSYKELLKAIHTVYSGGAYMTDLSIGIIQKHLSYSSKSQQCEFDNSSFSCLSETERKVLWYITQHQSIKQIAEALFVSPHTINNHQANIRHKLKLKGRNTLLQYALNVKGLIEANNNIKLKK